MCGTRLALACGLALVALPAAAGAQSLARRYPASLDFREGRATICDWACTPDDVWALKAFRSELGSTFTLELGPSTVVFGASGKIVVWAALLPQEPAPVRTTLAGGGDESLAARLAGRFLAEARVYSKNRYRAGPERDALGPVLERVCEPRGPWRYEGPLQVLIGPRTMSSAESFALMLAQAPRATLLGGRTAGASARPKLVDDLPGGIRVRVPTWLDLTPDGKPFEDVGLAPDVAVETALEDFDERRDPVLAKALELLRKTPKSKRRAARAG